MIPWRLNIRLYSQPQQQVNEVFVEHSMCWIDLENKTKQKTQNTAIYSMVLLYHNKDNALQNTCNKQPIAHPQRVSYGLFIASILWAEADL